MHTIYMQMDINLTGHGTEIIFFSKIRILYWYRFGT